jgi:preprotein translocase subunit SecG
VGIGFIVLVQNQKGGGLAGSFAGLSNQFMGVKQTTDVLEKGTWLFAAVIGVLCLASTFFISGGSPGNRVPDAAAPQQQAPNSPLQTPPPQQK